MLAPVGDVIAGPEALGDFDRLLQLPNAAGRAGELPVVRPVLVLLPARADTEDHLAGDEGAEIRDHLRQQRRVPVRLAEDDRAPREVRVAGGEEGERRPAL